MSTRKLVVLMVGWFLASITIAIVISIVLTEVLVLVGLVDWGTPEYSWILNGLALVLFLALMSIPFVFRKRFVDRTPHSANE